MLIPPETARPGVAKGDGLYDGVVAIKPHCVVCGFDSDAAGAVEFADYFAGWQPPPYAGWSNELGVTAPPGVGLFCERHLRQAGALRRLTATEAVDRLKNGSPRRAGWRRLTRRGD